METFYEGSIVSHIEDEVLLENAYKEAFSFGCKTFGELISKLMFGQIRSSFKNKITTIGNVKTAIKKVKPNQKFISTLINKLIMSENEQAVKSSNLDGWMTSERRLKDVPRRKNIEIFESYDSMRSEMSLEFEKVSMRSTIYIIYKPEIHVVFESTDENIKIPEQFIWALFPYDWMGGNLGTFGCTLKHDETYFTCAMRGLNEEFGIEIDDDRLEESCWIRVGKVYSTDFILKTNDWEEFKSWTRPQIFGNSSFIENYGFVSIPLRIYIDFYKSGYPIYSKYSFGKLGGDSSFVPKSFLFQCAIRKMIPWKICNNLLREDSSIEEWAKNNFHE